MYVQKDRGKQHSPFGIPSGISNFLTQTSPSHVQHRSNKMESALNPETTDIFYQCELHFRALTKRVLFLVVDVLVSEVPPFYKLDTI